MKKLTIVLLLISAGCVHQLTAPLSDVPVTSMASYFWTGSAINFKDTTGKTTDQITFRDSGNFLLADDADANGKLLTTIACTVSPDTVFAENFVPNCVLDIDAGWYFSPADTLALVPHVLSAAVVTNDGTAYVATDSGVWSASVSGGRFSYDAISDVSDIDALTASEGDSIFAGTRSGQIWIFDPHSTNIDKWSIFPASVPQSGAITAIACDIGSLYALVNGIVYQFMKHGSSWSQLSFLSSKKISAIRANVSLNNTEYLLIGSIDGTVGGYPAALSGTKFQQNLTLSGAINDFASVSTSILSVATDSGIYQGGQTGSIPPLTALTNKHTTSLVNDASGVMYFISGESVYSAPSNGTTSASSLPKFYSGNPLKLLSESTNSYLLTNAGLYQHTALGWDTIKGFPRTYYPNLQGGLLLLKSNPEIDSSWRAGTLVTNKNMSYPITARLLSRLDTLLVSGKQYSDVLVVRYSDEGPGEIPNNNLPYWVIYYQRGRGPIMFDRVNPSGGAPERKVVAN